MNSDKIHTEINKNIMVILDKIIRATIYFMYVIYLGES